MNHGEKLYKFCDGLKPQIRLEVLNMVLFNIEHAARIVLNVDSTLFVAGML